MQYLLLIYEDESVYEPDKQGEAMNRVVAGHMALSQSMGPKRLAGAAKQPSSILDHALSRFVVIRLI